MNKYKKRIALLFLTASLIVLAGFHSSVQADSVPSAKKALDRLDTICKAARSIAIESSVKASIQTFPGGKTSVESYRIVASLQHPGLGRFTERRGGATLVTYISNAKHMIVYSPQKRRYTEGDPAPVEFAVADMFTGTSDPLLSDEQALGTFIDLWGYFSSFTPQSPWKEYDGQQLKMTAPPTFDHIDGHSVIHLRAVITAPYSKTDFDYYLDRTTGCPVRISYIGVGRSVDDVPGQTSRVDYTEDYTVFRLSRTLLPQSSFEFNPPSTATIYTDTEPPDSNTKPVAQSSVPPAAAQSAPPQPALLKLDTLCRASSGLSYRSHITQLSTKASGSAGSQSEYDVTATFQKPNLLLLSVSQSGKEVARLVCGSKTCTLFDPVGNRYSSSAPPSDWPAILMSVFTNGPKIAVRPLEMTLGTIDKFCTTFDVLKADMFATSKSATLATTRNGLPITDVHQTASSEEIQSVCDTYIDPASNLPIQVDTTVTFGKISNGHMTESYSSFKLLTVPAADSTFTFIPPAGATVYTPPVGGDGK